MTRTKVIRIFAVPAAAIYVFGVLYSHVLYSADDRAACHQAGGFMGRIFCPDSVDTVGFGTHFARAIVWPAEILGVPVGTDYSRKSLAAAKRRGETPGKLRPLALQGDATAQFKLGLLYEDGRGVPTDFEESAKWFRLAAEQGDSAAQNSLSFAYAKGKGVGQNLVEAYKWASLAALRGTEELRVERQTLIADMSDAEIDKAKRLAREWQPKSAEAASQQLREESERQSISEAQRLLGALGYRLGDASGVAGRRTRAAISEFQFREGMATSGEVSRELIARLRNEVKAKQAGAGANKK